MKTRFITLLLFSAATLFALSGCEPKAKKCYEDFITCFDKVDKAQRQNDADWQACLRTALDAQRDGLRDCQELRDDAARNACFNRITAEYDRAAKACTDDYEKKKQTLQAEMDACISNYKKCMGD
jgi:hypothetical protein